jgi:hypothetical protein
VSFLDIAFQIRDFGLDSHLKQRTKLVNSLDISIHASVITTFAGYHLTGAEGHDNRSANANQTLGNQPVFCTVA